MYCSRDHAFAYWRERGKITADSVVRRATGLIQQCVYNETVVNTFTRKGA